ncbi:hypothetical protein JTE90_001989 [Oedothorax gibbosus]|uniref:RRM domain-containing protein n=1 Tax=Oedothorax gibbosus TaxID=931172 RepID=A0AAV6TN01_9ARAC|nr:hypothetical protein JTE90_001989 [Oedothorax gibbosus]
MEFLGLILMAKMIIIEYIMKRTLIYNCLLWWIVNITRDLLKRTFQPYGEIEEITCFDDSRNYAFVRFATKEAAIRAICHLNDTLCR